MSFCTEKMRESDGQATVEAAYLIPVVFVLLLLLIQPGIILYDRMVMKSAAAEGCRLLATKTEAIDWADDACKAYLIRRLGSVPPADVFHVHDSGCTWEIEIEGDESSSQVKVTIRNTVRLLPLVSTCSDVLGVSDGSGHYTIEVSESAVTQPAWVENSDQGLSPRDWVKQWL